MLAPAAIGALGRHAVLQFPVVVQPAVLQIDADHLARPQSAFLDNFPLVDKDHSGLRARQQQAVFRHRIAHRPQPVAVQPGQRPASGEGADCRRAIPGFHHRAGISVKFAMRVGDALAVRPGLGDH
jgi:hypothetical protein